MQKQQLSWSGVGVAGGGLPTMVTLANQTPGHHTLEMTNVTGRISGDVTSVSQAPPNTSLRAKLQPFSDPQQVQEQLQRLNLQQQSDSDASCSQRVTTVTTGFLESSLSHTLSNGEVLPGNGSSSSIASSDVSSSRRSSAGSRSMLEQLLSHNPPANPIPCPQTQGVPSSSSSNSLSSRSPPYQTEAQLHPLMARRLSNPYDTLPQQLAPCDKLPTRQQRYTLPDLYPHCRNPLMEQMAQPSVYPSFPVNVHQRREGSPTKSAYSSSPTTASNFGRRSPIHEVQMDAIAEDTTESATCDKAAMNPSSPSNYTSVGSPRSSRVAIDNKRQRKTGMIVNNSAVHAQLMNSLQTNGKSYGIRRNSYPKQHQYIDASAHMPPYSQPRSHVSPTHTPTTSYAHTDALAQSLNWHNLAYQGAMAHPLPFQGAVDILGHVSMVLRTCGIPYQHSNGIFAVEHQGVKLQILVGTVPHLSAPSAIQLQYVAGDTQIYQTLCTHLASRLQFAAQ